MSNILEVRDLRVLYGKSVAIHDISLAVPQGGIVTLIGSNGAGKSTTLNAVLGMVNSTEGSVVFDGEDVTGIPTAERVKKGLVLVPEGRHLFPYLSVYKNLLLGAVQRKDKNGIQEDLEFVFELFPILKDRLKQKAGTMSGGQQQMLAIARGIMASPKLLCLDEPSLGLAPAVIEDIGVKIKEINKTKGTSILLVEQNVHLAFGTAQYCYTLQVGEVVAEGTTEEIRSNDVVKKAYFGG
jgi:branched-chain amino acid transport system ATP-binding protein